jgi:hypothetical protein
MQRGRLPSALGLSYRMHGNLIVGTTFTIDQLGLAVSTDKPVFPTSRSYRPPSWPPPRDWVCIEDADGSPVSRWGDPFWDLSPWSGCCNSLINFGDGPKLHSRSVEIDSQNADLFRMAITWRIWGFRGIRAVNSIILTCSTLRPIFAICSRSGILASDLSRYPRVVDKLSEELVPTLFDKLISELNTLLNGRDFVGFTILDSMGIARLKASKPNYIHKQTEYIPPRIWQYQVMRLKEFLDDYLSHQQQIEDFFSFCINAYRESNIDGRFRKKGSRISHDLPFSGHNPLYGTFLESAEQFGIKDILEKWVGTNLKKGIRFISMYLTMASYVGLAYILNFTLARVGEGMSLRFNCLKWDDDDIYGGVPLIEGKTTKTSRNDNALWVTSPSVEDAITVMQSVANLRSPSTSAKNQEHNIFLINFSQDPWQRKGKNLLVRPKNEDFYTFVSNHPLLFEKNQLLITEEDFKIALAATPTINQKKFQIGKPWSFSWHQLRRTGAVNMFSSGDISDASIRLQLKHLSPVMTQYYGRGHTTLNLSEKVKNLIVNAQYEAMGKMFAEAHSDRFISPFGPEHKEKLIPGYDGNEPINLIGEDKAAQYQKAARAHKINFRITAVGACMKNGRCDGDGFSALSDCAGGDGRAPCTNALFDRNRAGVNKTRLEMVIKQIELEKPDTPRYRHLEQERRGLENYFAFIK